MDGSIEVTENDPSNMEFALKKSLLSRNKLAIIVKGSNGKMQYCCVECSARYEEKKSLEQHLYTHNKEYRYLCGICGTGLKRKEHLDRHTMEHLQVRPHVCQVCGKGFKRKEHLNIHRSTHNGDKSQVCALCNRSFHRKDHLQKHLQTHSKFFTEHNFNSNGDEGLMDVKHELFDGEETQEGGSDIDYDNEDSESQEHSDCNGDSQSSDHADVKTPMTSDRPYICAVCFKSYKRKDHLKIHSWTHMKKDKVCSECGEEFHMNEQLQAHMRVCIQIHLKMYQSSNHMESLEENDPLALLMERPSKTTDSEQRPHVCVVCGRRFKRKQHLKVHANVHLKQTPRQWCVACNEGFASNEQYQNHQCMSQYNGEKNDIPIIKDEHDEIPIIGEEHEGIPILGEDEPGGIPIIADEHVEHMEDEYIIDETKLLPPLDAKKENSNPSQFLEQNMIEEDVVVDTPSTLILQDEQNIPVPQRVYVCKYCSKPFKRKDHYKIHLHVHTGVKSFFCVDCGKGFYRKDHLQKHWQVHTKPRDRPKPKKQLPDLFPISMLPTTKKNEVKPEITIHAPSNAKLRVPLQIKVPYQMVTADGSVTINPHQGDTQHEIFT
ncbi:hypothetical protein ACJJTC_003897 [Scirpophaga incertulas]